MLSPPDAAKSSTTQTPMTFEKARTRARVLIPVRNPPRVRKHLLQPITSLRQRRQKPAAHQPGGGGGGGGSAEYWSNRSRDDQLSQTPLLKPISNVSEVSGYLNEPSEPSIDLNTFPLPPTHRKLPPVADGNRLHSTQPDNP